MPARPARESLVFSLCATLGGVGLWLCSPGEKRLAVPPALREAAAAAAHASAQRASAGARTPVELPAGRTTPTGRVRDGERGIAGASVRLAIVDSEENVLRALPAATTDAEGAFPLCLEAADTLSPLLREDACLLVAAEAPGFRPSEDWWGLAELVAGRSHVSLELLPRTPGDRRLSGRVVDMHGRPVGGAAVCVVSLAPEIGDRIDVATTDEHGCYAMLVDGPDGTECAVFAEHVSCGTSELLPLPPRGDAALPVLALQPRPGQVRGIARYPDGSPASGAVVSLYPVELRAQEPRANDPRARLWHQEWVSRETDARGDFVFENLATGAYEVEWDGRDEDEDGARTVRTGDPPIELVVRRPRLTVSVTDGDGVPLRSAYYRLMVWSGPAADRAQAAWVRDALDRELIALAEVDRHDARENPARHWPEPASFCVAECSFRGAGPVVASCRLLPGQLDARLDLRLQRASTSGAKLRVVDAAGRAISRVAYRARALRTGGDWIDGAGTALRDGWRSIEGDTTVPLPAGRYELEILGDPVLVAGLGRLERPYDPWDLLPLAGATGRLHAFAEIGADAVCDVIARAAPQARLTIVLRKPTPARPPASRPVQVEKASLSCGTQPPIELELTDGASTVRTLVWRRREDGTARVLYPRDIPYDEAVSCFAGELIPPGRWTVRVENERLVPLETAVELRASGNRIELDLAGR